MLSYTQPPARGVIHLALITFILILFNLSLAQVAPGLYVNVTVRPTIIPLPPYTLNEPMRTYYDIKVDHSSMFSRTTLYAGALQIELVDPTAASGTVNSVKGSMTPFQHSPLSTTSSTVQGSLQSEVFVSKYESFPIASTDGIFALTGQFRWSPGFYTPRKDQQLKFTMAIIDTVTKSTSYKSVITPAMIFIPQTGSLDYMSVDFTSPQLTDAPATLIVSVTHNVDNNLINHVILRPQAGLACAMYLTPPTCYINNIPLKLAKEMGQECFRYWIMTLNPTNIPYTSRVPFGILNSHSTITCDFTPALAFSQIGRPYGLWVQYGYLDHPITEETPLETIDSFERTAAGIALTQFDAVMTNFGQKYDAYKKSVHHLTSYYTGIFPHYTRNGLGVPTRLARLDAHLFVAFEIRSASIMRCVDPRTFRQTSSYERILIETEGLGHFNIATARYTLVGVHNETNEPLTLHGILTLPKSYTSAHKANSISFPSFSPCTLMNHPYLNTALPVRLYLQFFGNHEIFGKDNSIPPGWPYIHSPNHQSSSSNEVYDEYDNINENYDDDAYQQYIDNVIADYENNGAQNAGLSAIDPSELVNDDLTTPFGLSPHPFTTHLTYKQIVYDYLPSISQSSLSDDQQFIDGKIQNSSELAQISNSDRHLINRDPVLIYSYTTLPICHSTSYSLLSRTRLHFPAIHMACQDHQLTSLSDPSNQAPLAFTFNLNIYAFSQNYSMFLLTIPSLQFEWGGDFTQCTVNNNTNVEAYIIDFTTPNSALVLRYKWRPIAGRYTVNCPGAYIVNSLQYDTKSPQKFLSYVSIGLIGIPQTDYIEEYLTATHYSSDDTGHNTNSNTTLKKQIVPQFSVVREVIRRHCPHYRPHYQFIEPNDPYVIQKWDNTTTPHFIASSIGFPPRHFSRHYIMYGVLGMAVVIVILLVIFFTKKRQNDARKQALLTYTDYYQDSVDGYS